MTLKQFIDSSIISLGALYPHAEAKAIAFRLIENYLDIPSYKYISEPEMPLLEGDASDQLTEALSQLSEGRPLQYVLGHAEFCGHRFRVSEGCLIPRPETEELVYRIIDECEGMELNDDEPFNILDLCTGSGCIAYSLAFEFPEAMVYACDVSNEALKIACRQRVKLKGASPVIFWADILQNPPAGLPKFDVIVSNPPYVCESERTAMRKNVLDYEPSQALFVPDDDPLVFYRAISHWADVLLKPGGRIYLEINERFGPQTAALFPDSELRKDISGRDRFVVSAYKK